MTKKKIVSILLVIALLLALVGGVVGTIILMSRVADPVINDTNGGLNQGSGVTDDAGNDLDSETVYPMPGQMIFTNPTLQSGAPNGVTVTATITPDTATDKTVSWYIEFVDPAAEWAVDKVVTDYVTVTPESDGALTATVQCLQAFGAQVKIKVVSRDNPEATAECVVDFGQKIASAMVMIGDMSVNMALDDSGAVTNEVKFELNKDGRGQGGLVSASYDSTGVYTIADTFEMSGNIRLVGTLDGYAVTSGFNTTKRSLIGVIVDALGKNVYFDCNAGGGFGLYFDIDRSTSYSFSNHTVEENIAIWGKFINSPYITVALSLKGKHYTYEFFGKINVSGYSNHSLVSNITINNSAVVL